MRLDTLAILFLLSSTSRTMRFSFAHCNRVIGVVIQGIGEEEREEKECLVSQKFPTNSFLKWRNDTLQEITILLFKN